MVRVTRTFTVDKPSATVIDYLADFAHAEQWDPGTERCVRIGDGPVAVGATWRNTSKVMGRTVELTYRLQRLDDNGVTLVGTNDSATSTDDIAVRPIAGGSEVTYTAGIELHGLAKLGAPLLKREFEKLGDETVAGITRSVARLP